MVKKIIIIGCGGHSKILIDIILSLNNYEIVGFYDDNIIGLFYNYPIFGKVNEIVNDSECYYIIGIGNNKIRKFIFEKYNFLNWDTLIHPNSIISRNATIKKGSVVCAGSVIQTEVIIGENCIINTNCNVDHESLIGNHSSICPGSVICGRVIIEDFCFIGANSTIIEKLQIGYGSIIGAGSVIIRNVLPNSKVVGNPGKIIN